jgi:4-azaleucine resistance transporter AzlC
MKRPLWEGFRDTIPLGIGVVLYGVVYGMLGRQGGVPFWFILGMSLLVFAGSSQMAAVELLVSGAGPLSTVLTICVVNLRHVVMGADLSRFLTGAKGRERAVNAFFLTDEVYAVTYTHFRSSPLPSAGRRDMVYMRGSGLCIYSFWALSGAAGYLGGQLVPPLLEPALGFAMSAVFLAMLLPLVRDLPTLASVLVSAVTAVAGYLWLPGKWYILLAALAGCLAGFLCGEWKLSHASGRDKEAGR